MFLTNIDRHNAHAQRDVLQRGFVTLNKLKTHMADRKSFQTVPVQFIV